MSNNLNDSKLLGGLNSFLAWSQKGTAFFFDGEFLNCSSNQNFPRSENNKEQKSETSCVSKSSLIYEYFLQNIEKIVNFWAFLLLFLSIFANSETLGMCTFLGFFALLSKYLFKKGETIEIDKIDFFVIIYVILFTLSTFWSSWFFDSMHGLIKTYTYFFAYLIFKDIFKTKPLIKLCYIMFLGLLCSVEAIICLKQQIIGVEAIAGWQDMTNIDPSQAMTRVFGTLKPLNPNLMAGYFISTFPCLLALSFYNFKTKSLEIWRFSFNKNFLFILCAILTFFATIFTGCRGSYIALLAQIMLVCILSYYIIWQEFSFSKSLKKIWLLTVGFCFLCILVGIFSSEALQTRILSIFSSREDSSNSFRMNVYQSSFQILKDNFLIGIGAGNWTFREVYGLYMKTGFDALGAYSVPLEIAVETGVFGLINFIMLIFFSLKKAIMTFIVAPYNTKILMTVPILTIIGMMLHGIIDTVWFRPQLQFVFWLMIAFLSTKNEEN